MDPVYSFLEINVHVNLTGMDIVGPSYELDMQDIYGGKPNWFWYNIVVNNISRSGLLYLMNFVGLDYQLSR